MNERIARSVGDRVEGKLGDLLTQVRAMLKDRTDDVLAIAYALELHKTITGEDVMAILNGTQGPLVDGRRYHSAAFRAGVVDYHNRAVLAHQARGDVGIAQVATSAGYGSEAAFSKAFKRALGMTPGAYRRLAATAATAE